MKKAIIIVAAVLLIAAAFLIFGGTFSNDNSATRNDLEGNPNKVYIGVFEPLTGVSSAGGNQEALGIRFASSEAPTVTIKGVEYEVVLSEVDNMSEDSIADATAQLLCDRKVSVVLGSYGSGLSLSGAGRFEAAGIPAIGISCTNPRITRDYDLYYRVCYLDSFQGKVLANFAVSNNYGTAAVVTQIGDVYSGGLGEYFTDEFEALGGKTVQFTYNSAQTSFTELIEDVSRSRADFIFLPGGVTISAEIIKQAEAANVELPFLGGDTWDTGVFRQAIADCDAEVYYSTYYDSTDTDNKAASDFAVKFQTWVSRDAERLKLNGGSSQVASVSALGYDAYMLALSAIEAADSTAPADIAKALGKIAYSGATGEIRFDGRGDPGKRTAYIMTLDSSGDPVTVLKSKASD